MKRTALLTGIACVLLLAAAAWAAGPAPLTVAYSSLWSDDLAGNVTFAGKFTGLITLTQNGNQTKTSGQYAWEDLGSGQTRVYGAYTATMSQNRRATIVGRYSIVLSGPAGGARPIISGSASIDSGADTYAAISQNGQAGTATGSFTAANVPSALTLQFPSVSY